jgi:hypothetical protein
VSVLVSFLLLAAICSNKDDGRGDDSSAPSCVVGRPEVDVVVVISLALSAEG